MADVTTVQACLVNLQGRRVSPVLEIDMVYQNETDASVFPGYDIVTTRMQSLEGAVFDVEAGSAVAAIAVAVGLSTTTIAKVLTPFPVAGTYTVDPLTLKSEELVRV